MNDIGKTLIRLRLLTLEQLETAKFLQSLEEPPLPLEVVLIQQGMIDPAALAKATGDSGAAAGNDVKRAPPGGAPGNSAPAPRSLRWDTGAASARATLAPVLEKPVEPPEAPKRRGELSSAPPRRIPRENIIFDLLMTARESGASALHVTAGATPKVRLNGTLFPFEMEPLTAETCREHLVGLLNETQYATFRERMSVDFCSDIGKAGRVRANIFTHRNGVAGAFRIVPPAIPSLEELGLPPVVKGFVEHKRGLVLITGSSGCGKSTTLASLVQLINKTSRSHVITLEDPIEYVIESDAAFITQREIHRHSRSFAAALHAALREDPDIIVVGELLDPESVSTAITAAETGHLVLGTCHTRSAPATVLRILDQFPPEKRSHVRTMLAGALRGVLCQELVPSADGQRRHLACEVAVINKAISNLIREDRLWQIPMVMQMNQSLGMQTMDDALDRLVKQGKISREEALARSADETRFGNVPA